MSGMSELVRFTIIYEDAGGGWTMARVAEVPEVITQGATVAEARSMVESALRDWLELYVQEHSPQVEIPPGARSESLDVTIAA